MNKELKELMIKHEGLKLKPYKDTVGKLTIGVGRNLDDNGISEDEAFKMLENDIYGWVIPTLKKLFPEFDKFSINRQNALISMMFNLGEVRFRGFKQMIFAIQTGNWNLASEQAVASKWYSQVKNRGIEIAHALLKG